MAELIPADHIGLIWDQIPLASREAALEATLQDALRLNYLLDLIERFKESGSGQVLPGADEKVSSLWTAEVLGAHAAAIDNLWALLLKHDKTGSVQREHVQALLEYLW